MKGQIAMEVKDITTYMRDNIGKNYKIEDIAAHFGYNKFEFGRKFKKRTGFSPSKFNSFLKIEKSLDEIISDNTDILVSQINAGYTSTGTFSNTFKKYTGCYPKEYRRQLKFFHDIVLKYIDSTRENGFSIPYINPDKVFLKHDSKVNSLVVNLIFPKGYRSEIVFIGIFETPVPDRLPVVGWAVIPKKSSEKYELMSIPNGKYYLLACSIEKTDDYLDFFILRNAYRIKIDTPFFFPDSNRKEVALALRKPEPTSLPILMNLPKVILETMMY